MKISQEVWREVVDIINYEFVRTHTPISVKLLTEAIIESQKIFEDEVDTE